MGTGREGVGTGREGVGTKSEGNWERRGVLGGNGVGRI